MGQRVGYVRVSSVAQSTERQLEGVSLDRTFTDTVSARDVQRPELQAMLEFVQDGDIVVVHSMDRLARKLVDLRQLVDTLTGRGVTVEFKKENLEFTGVDSPMQNMLLSMMGAVAEFERANLKERQAEGIAIARRKGLYTGRKPSINQDEVEELKRLATTMTRPVLAEKFGVSLTTVYKYLRQK